MIGYLYILGTIAFTVYGQLVLKWRISQYGALPEQINAKLLFLAKLFLDPFLMSGLASAFVASLFWILAMTKFELSFAYPFMSLSFVLVLFFSVLFFKEALTLHKVLGLVFIVIVIVIGIIVSSRS